MLMVHCEHGAIINYWRKKALVEHPYARVYHALTRSLRPKKSHSKT